MVDEEDGSGDGEKDARSKEVFRQVGLDWPLVFWSVG